MSAKYGFPAYFEFMRRVFSRKRSAIFIPIFLALALYFGGTLDDDGNWLHRFELGIGTAFAAFFVVFSVFGYFYAWHPQVFRDIVRFGKAPPEPVQKRRIFFADKFAAKRLRETLFSFFLVVGGVLGYGEFFHVDPVSSPLLPQQWRLGPQPPHDHGLLCDEHGLGDLGVALAAAVELEE